MSNNVSSARGRRWAIAALALAGALALAAGVAYAAIPDASGVIHACYNKASGKLRVTDATNPKLTACLPAKETALDWSQQGPAGATGPTGATGLQGSKGDTGATGPQGAGGPQGSAGVSGYAFASASTTIPAGNRTVGTLNCASGHAMGGGWTTSDSNAGVDVIGSGPTSDDTGWTGGMVNTSSTATTLTLSVICTSTGASSPSAQSPKAAESGAVFTTKKASAS